MQEDVSAYVSLLYERESYRVGLCVTEIFVQAKYTFLLRLQANVDTTKYMSLSQTKICLWTEQLWIAKEGRIS